LPRLRARSGPTVSGPRWRLDCPDGASTGNPRKGPAQETLVGLVPGCPILAWGVHPPAFPVKPDQTIMAAPGASRLLIEYPTAAEAVYWAVLSQLTPWPRARRILESGKSPDRIADGPIWSPSSGGLWIDSTVDCDGIRGSRRG
jgi:hypothetical protein